MVDINMTLFAQILNFLILVVILTKVAYKPLMKVLAEREEKSRKVLSPQNKMKLQQKNYW